jgi:type VI secretion system secreted protein VgrG
VQTIYGENFSTAEEGQTLAGIRAEEIFCQTKVYYGMASGPGLIPGTLITIDDPGQTFSGDYLIIHAAHEGQQPLTGVEEEFQYNNTFTMIPAAVQFRSQRLTPKPKIHATMNAVIDGDLSTETPDIDPTLGRYKVRLPFAPEEGGDDFSNKWGKSTSSYHVRMASPFAGTSDKTHGMNFPLHKGAEVVLSFRDGDPDLPVISGAVFNSQNFNVVTDKNPKQHVIKTPGGNQFVMDDTPGEEYMYLFSPFGSKGNWIYLGQGGSGTQEGAFKGEKGDKGDTGEKGESGKEAGSVMHVKSSGDKHEMVLGQETSFVIGSENYVTIGSKMEAMLGTASEFTMAMKSVFEWAGTIECKAGHHVEFGKTKETIKDEDELLGTKKVVISAGLPAAEKAILSTLSKTLIFGGAAVGALLAAFGGDIASAAYPDEESGVDAMKQMGVSMAPIAVGTALQVAALAYLVKKLNTELTHAISKIEMDDSGIKIHAKATNALGAPNNGIQLGIGPQMAIPTSLIKIAPTMNNNERISLENSNSTFITLTDGEFITITKTNGGNIMVDNTGVEISQANNGGKVTINDAGATMEKPAGGKVVASADDIKIQHGNDYISVSSQTGIKLNFLGANLHAGPLSIDPTGIIQLG